MSSKSLRQVTNYKPLSRCNIEELAVHQLTVAPSGGVLFARNQQREEKDAARKMVLNLFRTDLWAQHLRILTMPGVHWRFERKLLGKREGNWMRGIDEPKTTHFTAIENDRYIYYCAATQMPGLHTPKALTTFLGAPSFAERTMKTRFGEFLFANVDDLMRETTETWDAAWLDYTGPLSVERLNLIAKFYANSVRSTLIVTALKARWNRATSAAISSSGSHSEWLRRNLPGEVLHDLEYFDTSPMAQFAVSKQRPLQLIAAYNKETA